MFMMPSSSLRHGTQISGSINTPLYTAVSDTVAITFPKSAATQLPFTTLVSGAVLPLPLVFEPLAVVNPALLNGSITGPGPNVIQRASTTGGKTANVPQLADYQNARTAEGAKVYADPLAVYTRAVAAWLAELSLKVDPRNGLKYLTRTREFVNQETEETDNSVLPDCGLTGGPTGPLDSNGDPCGENSYTKNSGSSLLPCPGPAYPGASTATCGETFNANFNTAISEREYRGIQRQLANPIMSTSSTGTNLLRVSFQPAYNGSN